MCNRLHKMAKQEKNLKSISGFESLGTENVKSTIHFESLGTENRKSTFGFEKIGTEKLYLLALPDTIQSTYNGKNVYSIKRLVTSMLQKNLNRFNVLQICATGCTFYSGILSGSFGGRAAVLLIPVNSIMAYCCTC